MNNCHKCVLCVKWSLAATKSVEMCIDSWTIFIDINLRNAPIMIDKSA